jgi:hypothetical protein
VLEAIGWMLIGAGLWNVTYGVVTVQFGRSEPACASGRSPEDTVLRSLRRSDRLERFAWLGGMLIGVGLVFVGHESRNNTLTYVALAGLWATQVVKALLDKRRERKLKALMRQRRAVDHVTAGR